MPSQTHMTNKANNPCKRGNFQKSVGERYKYPEKDKQVPEYTT